LARALVDAGVKPGDRVVLLCENSPDYVFCYYGILKTGAIAVSLNTELKPDGLRELLGELSPPVLILSSKFETALASLELSAFGIRRLFVLNPRLSWSPAGLAVSSLAEQLGGRPEHNLDLEIDPRACAEIVYTSGSLGKPKGVMLSHANIAANTQAIMGYLDLTPRDVQMVVLPFFYVMGKSLLNTHIAAGGKIVINNQFAYTASVLRQMAEEGVTGFSGVPSTYAHLLFKSPLAQYRDRLPTLRYCSQAGGHMSKYIKLELLKILPSHTRLFIMYGATEASARLTYLRPEVLREKIESIGQPLSGVTIKILSAEGKILQTGETGELVAQGDNIMIGYYRDEDSTRKVLDRNGYHTGDMGYYDEGGFLYVTGRKDNQLKIGGHRVQPREIEDVLMESGLVYECLIFGIPDPLLGRRLAGLIVPGQPAPDLLDRILKYCASKLPKYKMPESLLLVESIPKNPNGKPDQSRSIELFTAGYYKGIN
jgi:long-chain acyl-CoA synthetase